MEEFFVAQTKSSPRIHFNPQTHQHEIIGESYPENSAKFYGPMFSWLEVYLGNVCNATVELSLDIVYFNSSSSKVFMDLLDLLDDAASLSTKVVVNWRYHEVNELALECGEEFMEDIQNIHFNLVSYQ
jgi:hypothetical protein